MKTLEFSNTPDYTEIPHTCGSDYSGDSVTLSNFQVLYKRLQRVKGIYSLIGYYGAHGLAYRPNELTTRGREIIADIVDSLESYPIIDDDHHTALEFFILGSCFKQDYKYGLKEYIDEETGDIPPDSLAEFFSIFLHSIGDYSYTETGAVPYINWARMIEEYKERLK